MILGFSKRSVYSEKYYIYQYTNNFFRVSCIKSCRNKGFETDKKINLLNKKTNEEDISRVSLSRTKRNIRELALCNYFEYFATITINSLNADRFSLSVCQNLLKKKLKKLKRKNPNFAYIFITEKHKDGAFHFHGLVRGIDFYTNNNGYLSNSIFDEIGFNSFSKIKNYEKCCNYITKYITKDCIKNEHNQIYICSRGLVKAVRYEISPVSLNWGFENDFCKIKDINLQTISKTELKNLLFIEEK